MTAPQRADELDALELLEYRLGLIADGLRQEPFEAALDRAAAGGFDRLAWMLRRVTELKVAAGVAASLVTTLMADVAATDLEVVDGLGTFERKSGTKRKTWDHDAAAADVYAWALAEENRTDPDTGETVPAAQAVRDALMAAVGPAYWRVKALLSMGLSPSLYCEETYGPRTLVARWNTPIEGEQTRPATDGGAVVIRLPAPEPEET